MVSLVSRRNDALSCGCRLYHGVFSRCWVVLPWVTFIYCVHVKIICPCVAVNGFEHPSWSFSVIFYSVISFSYLPLSFFFSPQPRATWRGGFTAPRLSVFTKRTSWWTFHWPCWNQTRLSGFLITLWRALSPVYLIRACKHEFCEECKQGSLVEGKC